MTLTILVPLDGSAFGEAALPAAAKIAHDARARLLLFQAIKPVDKPSLREDGQVLAYIDEVEATERQEALHYLHSVQDRVVREFGLEQVSVEAEPARPVEGIVEVARERGAGLIVMATHGRTGAARALRGSIAGSVLRKGQVPVTFIRPTNAA